MLEPKTIVEKIKSTILNYDLTIEYAKAQLEINKKTMELFKNSRKNWKKRRYFEAKIDKDRFEIFIEDLEKSKAIFLDNIHFILEKYDRNSKDVFRLYFLENKQTGEIAKITNMSCECVEFIVKKIKNDLIEFYCE